MGGTLTAQSAGEGTGTTMQYVMPLRLPSAPHGTPSAVNGSARDAADACEEANTSSAERLQRLRESFASASKRPSIVVPSPPCSPPSSPPRDDGTPSSTLSAAASPLSSSGSGSPLLHASPLCRVLVAEDDRLSQTLMRKLLPKMGFDPLVVDNGALALQAAIDAAPGGAHLSAVASCSPAHAARSLADYELIMI